MFDESFSLLVEDIEPIKEMLSGGYPVQININNYLYVVLAIDEANRELELEPIDCPPTYH
ncbi:MAG TPA: hypothetical protein V6D20_01260 [Candidatus Obscuribacterales bacterium]